MSGSPGIRLDNIDLTLGKCRVITQLCTTFSPGRWHAILGRSGCGKSSLLRLIAGIQPPTSGQVIIDGEYRHRATIAFMAQDDALLPWLTVRQNVQLGPRLRREKLAHSHDLATSLLQRVGLEAWAEALPAELSGGMRQRVALARTLLEDRAIVLMDEPFSQLDAITRDELQTLAASMLAGRTVLLVTHDPVEALRLSHELHIFDPGPPTRLRRQALQSSPPRAVNEAELIVHLPSIWQQLRSAQESTTVPA